MALCIFILFNPESFRIAKFFANFSFFTITLLFFSVSDHEKLISFTKNRLIFLYSFAILNISMKNINLVKSIF